MTRLPANRPHKEITKHENSFDLSAKMLTMLQNP